MGLLGDMVVRIKGDTGQLTSSLKSADRQVQKFARFILSGAGIGGAILIFRQFGKVVTDVVKLVGEQEEAEGKLRSAIKATGREAEISVSSIAGLANALQRTTVYGDEATLSAAAMLQQLANLDEKGLKALIPRVQNFAAAMGVDLQTAASLVGKTLGSSTNALSRYGVQVDMSGSKTQKLDGLVRALDDKFAGMAETMGDTTTGKLTILQNQFNDLKQQLATQLLPTLNKVMRELSGTLETWSNIGNLKQVMDLSWAISSYEKAAFSVEILQKAIKEETEYYKSIGLEVDKKKIAQWQKQITMIQQVLPLLDTQAKYNKKQADVSRAAVAPTEKETEAIQKQEEALERATAEWKEYEAGLLEVIAGFPELTRAQLGLTSDFDAFVDELAARQPEYEQYSQARVDAIILEVQEKKRLWDEEVEARQLVENEMYESSHGGRQKEEEDEKTHQAKMKEIRQAAANAATIILSSIQTMMNAYYAGQLDNENLTDKERKKIQRKQAASTKALGLFEATIHMAEGIADAIPKIPLMILASVAGLAQIAAIASTPLPKLARGGKLNRPTMVMAGEAGPEWFLPDMRLEELGGKVADALQRAQITNVIQNNQPIQLAINLDGRQLDAHVQRSIGDRRIVVDKGAVR